MKGKIPYGLHVLWYRCLIDRLTFLSAGGGLLIWWVVFGFAHALDVDLLCFTEFTAVLALSDGTTLLLDLKEGTVGVFAGRGAMAFDTCFAVSGNE